jgi:glycosyltransferase involved in cell wall biosynthesis
MSPPSALVERPDVASALAASIKCLLLAGTDPITGKLRRGPYLRVLNPPQGVSYCVRTERLAYPKEAAHYNLTPLRVGLNAFRFFAEHLSPLKQRGFDVAHSFFWDMERFEIPWIHENDQSVGQFMSEYLHLGEKIRNGASSFFASYLNSSLCKQVIVWSEWAKEGYEKEGVERSKIAVIPPPFRTIDDRRPHEHCNILFVGRDFLRKGGPLVLKTFEKISRGFDDVRLIYVGKIWDKKWMKKVEENRKITHFSRPTDRVMREEIFPSSDIFVLPTRADAFAISVVEAMSRGIPVVASNVCALPEIVEDGVSGFLAKPDDLDTITLCVAKLVENPSLRESVGYAAQRRITEKFAKEKINPKLCSVYERAVNS